MLISRRILHVEVRNKRSLVGLPSSRLEIILASKDPTKNPELKRANGNFRKFAA